MLSDAQMGIIQNWFSQGSFATTLTTPALLQKFGASTLSDLAFLQWGTAEPLNNASIASIFASKGSLSPFAPGAPEIALAPIPPLTISMTWVEPDTGKVMKYQKSGQINVWVLPGTTNSSLGVWNKNFLDGVVYPYWL